MKSIEALKLEKDNCQSMLVSWDHKKISLEMELKERKGEPLVRSALEGVQGGRAMQVRAEHHLVPQATVPRQEGACIMLSPAERYSHRVGAQR
ncbi:hypothetical protein E2C01_007508 [Portunus trituberculatus]|uniref:Uncharacterized protein n=1 Tax=Portunus trituberculatus TaxID=210409 RepID=A0A5B7CY36_PORTR|nr:hypothetical protein [Portunus trituberculatus]